MRGVRGFSQLKPKGHARRRKAKVAQAILILLAIIIIASPSFLFVAEDYVSGSAYGFTIGDSYETTVSKINSKAEIQAATPGEEIWINFGGLWHTNKIRLGFNEGKLSKIERRKTVVETP